MAKIGKQMNRQIVAKELLKVARELVAIDFPSKEAYKKYLDEHPDADKSNHRVVPVKKVKPVTKQKPKGSHITPNHITLSKHDLKKLLSKGHFSIISAGRNPNHPEESKMSPDDLFFKKRHDQLREELDKSGLKYTEAIGRYGGKEDSFMVIHDEEELPKKSKRAMIVHYNKPNKKTVQKKVEELGRKFNQDSVLHGSSGKNEISFTTGKHAGQRCGGKGWKDVPAADDYYTEVALKRRLKSKFSMNVDDCFSRGFFASVIFRLAKSVLSAKTTRATVKSVLNKMGILDSVEISGDEVLFYRDTLGDKTENIAKKFAKLIGATSSWNNGSVWSVKWKGEGKDFGDWNDKSSKWHY